MGHPNPPQADGAAPVSPLDAAAREVLKGTLVPLKAAVSGGDAHGLVKYGTVRQLQLAQGETDAVREHLQMASRLAGNESDAHGNRVSAATLDLFRSFEQPLVPALRPRITAVAAVPVHEIASFANALAEVRAYQTRAAQENQLPPETLGGLMRSLNGAVVAARSFAINTAAQPLGMLNLERIEMVPTGIQRGELVATIPLAPGEETAVTHKEWSVTSKEFTTIVTDSLENTSETGVTDNHDLSQSTTSQNQHSTQFNITGTVQGGIPMINGSSTAGATDQSAKSASATDSIKHATAITQKASARSRQEHKTTISTTTVTGTSETSTRILKNTSTSDPIRIDYFSLLRKWRVRLYRFSLRLTYDLVVPEPAAAMRRAYAELAWLRAQLGPFVFPYSYSDIDPIVVDEKWKIPDNPPNPTVLVKPKYQWIADRYGTAVKPYPSAPPPLFLSVRGDGNLSWSYLDLEFNVPAGSHIREMRLSALVGINDGQWPYLRVLGAKEELSWEDQKGINFTNQQVVGPDNLAFMHGATGGQKIVFWLWRSDHPALTLEVLLDTTPETTDQWQIDTFNALYAAAQTQHYAEQQDIAARISAIEEQLTQVDTLTLRREESDEIMKCVLRFVLGADFDFMPDDVKKVFEAEKVDVVHGVGFDGPKLGLSKDQWSTLQQHEDMVRFINEAIEWENVVTFLVLVLLGRARELGLSSADLRHPDPHPASIPESR